MTKIRIGNRPYVALACIVLLAGCAENNPRPTGDGAAERPAQAQKIQPEQPMTPRNTGKVPPAGSIELSAGILAPAIGDLAARVGATEAEIRVLRAIPVVWNDGSAGCPQPGRSYTQALVPGYWVVLEYQNRLYSYHSGNRGSFKLCENARPDPVGNPPRGRYNSDV